MSTLFKFVGGPLDGMTETVNLSPNLVVEQPGSNSASVTLPSGHVATLVVQGPADTLTLEFPSGFTLGDALNSGHVRLIAEKTSPKSLPNRIVRYRNAGNGQWKYVSH